jgi:hypothetical protein
LALLAKPLLKAAQSLLSAERPRQAAMLVAQSRRQAARQALPASAVASRLPLVLVVLPLALVA